MLELNLNLLAEIGGWPALKEARVLVERGRVSEARREGAVIRARVQGGEKVHEPQITLADRVADVDVRCTCLEFRKAGRVCPHILAAGVALLQPPKPPKVAVAGPRDGTAHEVRRVAKRTPVRDPGQQIIFSRRTDGALVMRGAPSTSGAAASTRASFPHNQIADFLSRANFPHWNAPANWSTHRASRNFALRSRNPHSKPGSMARFPASRWNWSPGTKTKFFRWPRKTDSAAYQRYVPDPRNKRTASGGGILFPSARRWRRSRPRDLFSAKNGTAFSLAQENNVARFLANTLPRWRRDVDDYFRAATRIDDGARSILPSRSFRCGRGRARIG